MKLYYDMLVPFIPNSTKDEKTGEMSVDARLDARRQAMIELSNFQRTGNGLFLTQAVVSACRFASVDVVSTLLTATEKSEVAETADPMELTDKSAKLLLGSLTAPFDIYLFTANLLMALHIIIMSNTNETTEKGEI